MSEEKKTFKFGNIEYPVTAPKGRKGRLATAYVMEKFGVGQEDVSNASVMGLLNDEVFETKHLSAFINVPQEVLEVEGTTGETLNALTLCLTEALTGFETPEVEAALKNSQVDLAEEKSAK